MEEPDGALVERARRGDGAAIGALFSRYWRAARAAAFGVTGEFASAEDAAAEAFTQALAGLASLREPDRFGPWLRTIVVRTAGQSLHRGRPAPDTLLEDLPDSNERPDDLVERLELETLIQRAVRDLPARLREAVSLFYLEGYESDDAARFLEIPPGTFRRRLHEGRRCLRRAIDRILKAGRPMNEKREREIERLKRMIDDAETGDPGPLYQAFRSSLALRPVPDELVQALAGRQRETLRLRAASNAPELANLARETIRQFTGPSDRARDPNSAVGSVAAAIKRVLPEFEEWTLDASEAAAQLLAFPGDRRDLLKGLMPPGFANGRPGAFLRATRALLIPGDGGVLRTAYELLEDSPDPETFRAGMQGVRVGDVLDLTWMAAGPLELRSVQELLERLIAAVLPGASSRFASYDEPRYRAALRLLLGDESARAATGGVLAVWQGSPDGVGAAHVRIYLEPWATVLSGKPVETAAPIP